MYGRKIIEHVLRTKERNKDVESLLKEKKFDEIFTKYGQNIYLKTVPYKVRIKDANNLFKQGRYEDIYIKHGSKIYESYLHKMKIIDILTETGNKQIAAIEKAKYFFRRQLTTLLLSVGLGIATGEITFRLNEVQNAIEYSKDIEEYDEYIQKYAQEIKNMNLTDTQIFAKVMYDMWKEIQGYAEPQNDIIGYYRLTLKKEGRGVCRNFADDLTAKLNKINPEYNARNLTVYMDDGSYRLANIERTIIENEQTNNIINSNDENVNDLSNKIDIKKMTRKSYDNSC